MELAGADIGTGSATVLAASVVAWVTAAADLSLAATRTLRDAVSLGCEDVRAGGFATGRLDDPRAIGRARRGSKRNLQQPRCDVSAVRCWTQDRDREGAHCGSGASGRSACPNARRGRQPWT